MASPWDNYMIGLGYDPKGFSVVKRYDDDYNGNSEIGDLFTVPSIHGVYHAGVCFDEEMIVHFTMDHSEYERGGGSLGFSGSSSRHSPSTTKSSKFSPGLIQIVPVEEFSGGEKFAIYRKNDGIDVQAFKENVRKIMREKRKYNLFIYNCIHFAMDCLGLTAEKGSETILF